jgi:hypothetical protein
MEKHFKYFKTQQRNGIPLPHLPQERTQGDALFLLPSSFSSFFPILLLFLPSPLSPSHLRSSFSRPEAPTTYGDVLETPALQHIPKFFFKEKFSLDDPERFHQLIMDDHTSPSPSLSSSSSSSGSFLFAHHFTSSSLLSSSSFIT